MKKLLVSVLVGLSCRMALADTKISAMTSSTTLNAGDIVPFVANPSGTPLNRVISKTNLQVTLGVTAIATDTGTLSTSTTSLRNTLNTVATDTTTLGTRLTTVATDTTTLRTITEGKVNLASFTATAPILYDNSAGAISAQQISLSTGVMGTLASGSLVSTVPFTNSTNTWTGGNTYTSSSTFKGAVVISTSIDASGVGATGQFLKSQGPGQPVVWGTAGGSGDALLAATQTWTGGNTHVSSVTISTVSVFTQLPAGVMHIVATSSETKTLAVSLSTEVISAVHATNFEAPSLSTGTMGTLHTASLEAVSLATGTMGMVHAPQVELVSLSTGVTGSLSGTGVLNATQTWTGANTYVSSVTISTVAVFTQLSPGVMHVLTGSSATVTSLVSLSTEVTNTLHQASIEPLNLSTGTVGTLHTASLEAVSLATGTMGMVHAPQVEPISLSTGVTGTLASGSMVSTAAFLNSTQTWTAAQTHISSVTISTVAVFTQLGPGVVHILTGSSATVTSLVSLSTEVTNTLHQANIEAVSLSTGTMNTLHQASIEPLSLSTGTVGTLHQASHEAISLSTAVTGTLGSGSMVSTTAFTTSSQTFSGGDTFNSSTTFNAAMYVSTSILISAAPGTNGQVLTSGGQNAAVSWTTLTGAALASTQTFTGANNFTSSATFNSTFTINNISNLTLSASSLTVTGNGGVSSTFGYFGSTMTLNTFNATASSASVIGDAGLNVRNGIVATTVTLTQASAPGFPALNAIWNDSAYNALASSVSATLQNIPTTLFTVQAASNTKNTVASVPMLSTAADSSHTNDILGTLILPPNFFTVGKTVYVVIFGTHTRTGTPTLAADVALGGTVILSTTAVTLGTFVAQSPGRSWKLEAELTCYSTGSSAQIGGSGRLILDNDQTIGASTLTLAKGANTINTANRQDIQFHITWGTQSASNSLTVMGGHASVFY